MIYLNKEQVRDLLTKGVVVLERHIPLLIRSKYEAGKHLVGESYQVWLAGDFIVASYELDSKGRDPDSEEAIKLNPYAIHMNISYSDAAYEMASVVSIGMKKATAMPEWASRLTVEVHHRDYAMTLSRVTTAYLIENRGEYP